MSAPAADPLLTRRSKRPIIGYVLTGHYCRTCLPENVNAKVLRDELRDGDDAGDPFICCKCLGELKPRG